MDPDRSLFTRFPDVRLNLPPRPMRARTLTHLGCAILFAKATTAQVPVLVKDIKPTGPSNPIFLTCFGDVTYSMLRMA